MDRLQHVPFGGDFVQVNGGEEFEHVPLAHGVHGQRPIREPLDPTFDAEAPTQSFDTGPKRPLVLGNGVVPLFGVREGEGHGRQASRRYRADLVVLRAFDGCAKDR
ncbi:hypothetical protein GCM10010492_72740 [Saccharothrix mutabilis subsp. mutabilis]|uniref:Uncharacterized protein n=1 Tax=Saccharothrix mutabilis subsp. mutabilis TaxID=66855 RepID=A0ABN0UTM7_9PSEU